MASTRVIRELAARLGLDSKGFNTSIKDAAREAKEFQKTWSPTLGLSKDIGIAVGAAGTAVVTGMLAATRSAVNYGDALNDARQRTGVAVETLARYGFAAEQSGSSVAGLGTGLKSLAKNMQEAIGGSRAQREAFAELGLSSSALAAAQGDVNQIMLITADRFAAMEDGSEKTALAMKIFGRAGAELIPMLNEGSAGIRKLGDDAERAGLVISQDMASASDQLNDTLNELKASILGASIAIANPLVPIIEDAVGVAVEGTQAFGDFVKENQSLTTIVFATAGALGTLGSALTAVGIIAPKIIEGFSLIKSGASAVTVGMEKAATSMVGFNVVGASLSAQVIASSAALVGLTAALSINTGRLINWGIEGTKAQKWLDAFSTQALGSLHMLDALTDAQKSHTFTLKATADGWVDLGDAVAAATPKTTGWSDAAKKLKLQLEEMQPHLKTDAELTKDLAKFMDEQAASAKRLEEKQKSLTDALEETVRAERDLKDSFVASLIPANELWRTIDVLNDEFSNKDIVKIYGDQIIEATKKQRDHGFKISENILLLERMALAARGVSAATASINIPKAGIYANPTPANQKDPFGGWDPFGVWQNKGITGVAAQTATPNISSTMSTSLPGNSMNGGDPWQGGWVNGVYFPPAGSISSPTGPTSFASPNAGLGSGAPAQGTSTFGDVSVTINTSKPVDATLVRHEVIPLIMEALELGHGREKLTGIVKGSMNGVTSTKV